MHRRRGVERDARGLVVGDLPPRAEPELEPLAGEDVEGGGFTCQNRGIAEVVGQDDDAQPDAVGERRDVRQRDQRRELAVEMIGQ